MQHAKEVAHDYLIWAQNSLDDSFLGQELGIFFDRIDSLLSDVSSSDAEGHDDWYEALLSKKAYELQQDAVARVRQTLWWSKAKNKQSIAKTKERLRVLQPNGLRTNQEALDLVELKHNTQKELMSTAQKVNLFREHMKMLCRIMIQARVDLVEREDHMDSVAV